MMQVCPDTTYQYNVVQAACKKWLVALHQSPAIVGPAVAKVRMSFRCVWADCCRETWWGAVTRQRGSFITGPAIAKA